MKFTHTLIVALLLVPLVVLNVVSAESPHRNVVFILIDDLGHYGVSAYGANRMGFENGVIESVNLSTPRIDQLAREGLRCDNAFAYPLCEPTRIALMSAKYNNRNLLHRKAQHASDITFGDVFQRAGYATGMTGKWKQSRGTKEIPAEKYVSQFGWDEFCCFDVHKQGRRFINPSLVINGEPKDYQEGIDPATGRRWFGPDICNRFALDFIERHKDEPFFLYYPMMLVHDEDEGDYHLPTPDTLPHSVFDQFDENPGKPQRPHPGMEYFPDMIRYTDKLIGNVVDKLESLGLRENTLVVVMGDNGTQRPFIHVFPDGSEYPGHKGRTNDHGMHVALVLSLPGVIPTGNADAMRAYDGLVDLVDIYPTLCEATGIVPANADEIDGISFWQQALGNKTNESRDWIYVWYDETIDATKERSKDDVVLEFAFDKHFKRYSPHPGFPRGRFFDVRADSTETGGAFSVNGPNFGILYHSGLDLDQLTAEQQAAFDRLGEVISANCYVAVQGLKIASSDASLTKGQTAELEVELQPANVTRNNVIWESSDPSIASVDKFGVVTAHEPGKVTVSVYSWDDAHPLASGAAETYPREGISDSIQVHVQ